MIQAFALYLFFLTIGMTWVDLPIPGANVKPFQLAGLLVFLSVLVSGKHLKIAFRILKDNAFLYFLVAMLLLSGLVVNLTGPSTWSLTDIAKMTFYFMFAVSAASIILEAERKGGSINFYVGGILTTLGLFYAIVFYSGTSLPVLFGLVIQSINTGDPNIIIFRIFGSGGTLTSEDGEGIRGLRHTLAIGLVVVLFFIADRISQKKNIIMGWIVALTLLALVLIIQSRSAWLALFVGFCLIFFKSMQFGRIRKGSLFASILMLSLLMYGLYSASDLLLARIENTQSADGRLAYLSNGTDLMFQSFPYPVNPRLIEGSPHNFVIDGALAYGLLGLFFCSLIFASILYILLKCFMSSSRPILAVSSMALIVRFLTAGSGLPGIGEYLGLAGIFVSQVKFFELRRASRMAFDRVTTDSLRFVSPSSL